MSETNNVKVQWADPLGRLAVLLTIIFVIAKIWFPENFPYSWWVAFSPIIASVALGISILLLVAIGFGVYLLVDYIKRKRAYKRGERARQERLARRTAEQKRMGELRHGPNYVRHK